MSNYALVEDGEVTKVGGLPKSWRNVSGLHLASDAELKEKGWLPFVEQPATLSKYEFTDGTEFKIEADRVVGVEKKRAMTDNEKSEYDQQVATEYQRERAVVYPSIEDVTVALAEKAEGDSTMWDAISKKRADVKKAYPKP